MLGFGRHFRIDKGVILSVFKKRKPQCALLDAILAPVGCAGSLRLLANLGPLVSGKKSESVGLRPLVGKRMISDCVPRETGWIAGISKKLERENSTIKAQF